MGREEHCKQISLACVGSACSVLATLGLHPRTVCILSWSTLLRLLVALQENCLKWALGCVYFPGLSPQVQVLGYSPKAQTWLALCFFPSKFRVAQVTRCLVSPLSPGGWCVLSPPRSQLLGFLGAQQECRLWCAVCLLWNADLWLQATWQISTVQDPRKTWLATGSLLAVW